MSNLFSILRNLSQNIWFNRILLVLTIIFVGGYMYRLLQGQNFQNIEFHLGWFVLAFFLTGIYMFGYASIWYLITVFSDLNLPWKESFAIWFFSNFGKYFPLKIAGLGYRVFIYHERRQKPISAVLYACFIETFICVLGGVVILMALWWFVDLRNLFAGYDSGVILLGLGMLLLFLPSVQKQIWQVLSLQTKAQVHVFSLRQNSLILISYACSWLFLGFILYIQALVFLPELALKHILNLSFVYALAGLAGMLSFFAPSGIGVREGVLMIGLGGFLPAHIAAILALTARFMTTCMEVAGIVISWLYLEKYKIKPMSNPKHPLDQIVDNGLCMSCGFCKASFVPPSAEVALQMVFDSAKDSFIPRIEHWQPNQSPGSFICPGQEMNMPELSHQVYGSLPNDYLLGHYQKLRVGSAMDPEIRAKAASGGAIPAILIHLFETGQIDAVYALHPGQGPYEAHGVIVRQPQDLKNLHGSVYHPFNYGAALPELLEGQERYAFVGLPCQIAGLEMLKKQFPHLAQRHILSIGLFCGGVNTFKGIAYYLKGFKVAWDKVQQISYRNGPWPGKIHVQEQEHQEIREIPRIRGNTRWKILRYVIGFQGYWMLKRCRLCPDQVSDFADIAVGDPHLPKYRAEGGAGFSAIVSRSQRGEAILSEMLEQSKLNAEEVSREVIVESQGYTLDNRRHSLAYLKVNKWLGGKNPQITYYPEVYQQVSFRHYVYAWVDLLKIKMPKNRMVELLYIPWQIFEYLFITFTPNLILKRLVKLIRNR